jgi:hypothetical protein
MAEVSEVYATIHVDGKVEFDESAKQLCKDALIKNIIGRSFAFLLSGALLIFSWFIFPYNFSASVITGYFGVALLVLGIVLRHDFSIDKKNVKIITDDKGNNWLLNLIRERSKRNDISQEQYNELCRSASLDINHFEFGRRKVYSIITRDNRRYSVARYTKVLVKEFHNMERTLSERTNPGSELEVLRAKREWYGMALEKITS